jgi:CLIP-associating protein 1/2
MEEEPLLEALPEMLPGLFEAFNDSNADVRKAVVFCLVRRGCFCVRYLR